MKHQFMIRKNFWLTVSFCLFLITPQFSYAQQNSPDKEKETFAQAVKALNNGSYDKALDLFNTLLQIRSEKYGLSSVPVANVMTNLGVIKSQLGLYDSAISFYEKSLPIYEALGNQELKRLASVYQNMGI